MRLTSYRLASYSLALASLGACGRASYQFTAPAAYLLPAAVVAPATADALGAARRPVCNTPTLVPAREPSSSAPPQAIQPKCLLHKQPPQAPLAQLTVRRTPLGPSSARASAAHSPRANHTPNAKFDALIVLAFVFILLITALVALVGTLLVRLIQHLVNKKSRHKVSGTAIPATTP
jgi:hypothetical protein